MKLTEKNISYKLKCYKLVSKLTTKNCYRICLFWSCDL